MTALRDRRSILALDPTSEGVAFTFFENGELLDWGTRSRRGEGGDLAVLDRLLDGYAADVVVLEDGDASGSRRYPRVRRLLRMLATHARRRGVRVFVVAREEVRTAWRTRGARNKEAAAAQIALNIPELQVAVPPKRKVTQNEDHRANIFDAASLALHLFGSLDEVTP